MSSFTGRRAEGHGRVIRRLDMKEQRFFVIMQIQLYVKLYFTAISDLLQFEPYCQPGFYGVLQIIAIGTISVLLSESLLAEVEEENDYMWLIFS